VGKLCSFPLIILGYFSFLLSGCRNFNQLFNIAGPNCSGPGFEIAQLLFAPIVPIIFATENVFLGISFYIVFGFLVGWAIHSLVRKLRYK
jgi:hypothetical protein